MKNFINLFITLILRLRYSITLRGLDKIKQNNKPILFLPNHPALIDPVILMNCLYSRFQPRPLAEEEHVSHKLLQPFIKLVRAVVIPDMNRQGRNGRERVRVGIDHIIDGLRQGDNILLYPAGRLTRNGREELGAKSSVETIVKQVKNLRIVTVRTTGLWGSSFSFAGHTPSKRKLIFRNLLYLLMNGFFFMPRRRIEIEFCEPDNFPFSSDRKTINTYLEKYYNDNISPAVYTPYCHFLNIPVSKKTEERPKIINRDIEGVPTGIRQDVLNQIKLLSGFDTIDENDNLAQDLSIDSLTLVEFGEWLHQQYNVSLASLGSLQTVADCILAAAGIIANTSDQLKPINKKWAAEQQKKMLNFPNSNTIAACFLEKAAANPGQAIVADQISGVKTYRQLIMSILALLPKIRTINNKRIGILLPASVSAVLSYLSVLFAGKVAVQVNWTTGISQIKHCLDKTNVSTIISAKAVTDKLRDQGIDLDCLDVKWLYLENIASEISVWQKLKALFGSYLSWRTLKKATIDPTAVILFTSGSEAMPKSVPLSHTNILTNCADTAHTLSLTGTDRLLGILPPFHSLGLSGTIIMPLCLGLRTAYHHNPTEGARVAQLIDGYQTTLLLTTPTFLNAALHASSKEQLKSLRLVFSGAEKCPDTLYTTLKKRYPKTILCEGYGVTECSPVISVNRPDNPSPATIGSVLPSIDYEIIHPETHIKVTPGEAGVLIVRGPNIFSGYLEEGQSPFLSFSGNQWYNTGDLVTEHDGILTFSGRLKRFIKLGGEMVSLPAIEQVMGTSFEIEDGPSFAVTATNSDNNPEIVLFTISAIDRTQANKAIKAAGLSGLHNIRQVINIDQIPLLGSGKTDYNKLDALYLAK